MKLPSAAILILILSSLAEADTNTDDVLPSISSPKDCLSALINFDTSRKKATLRIINDRHPNYPECINGVNAWGKIFENRQPIAHGEKLLYLYQELTITGRYNYKPDVSYGYGARGR